MTEMNHEPEKWRDGIDPASLPLKKVRIRRILGYPHAGNQVFQLLGDMDGKEDCFYLKYAHRPEANFKNEVEIIQRLRSPLLPEVVEYDAEDYRYEVTRQIEGKRLSVILWEAGMTNGMEYMAEYGRTLAQLHGAAGDFPDARRRRFHEIPDGATLDQNGMTEVGEWLRANHPRRVNRCFVHGDFHYANLLWREGKLSGILDFELAGMGNREFDIAWAMILRPGQKFMQTREERQEFLKGYASLGSCDPALVRYYMVLIYTYFLKAGDEAYEQFIRREIRRYMAECD